MNRTLGSRYPSVRILPVDGAPYSWEIRKALTHVSAAAFRAARDPDGRAELAYLLFADFFQWYGRWTPADSARVWRVVRFLQQSWVPV